MISSNRNINNIFFIFALSHLLIWTVVPTITNKNLPLDVIEALAWGSNLDWGFNKHPPGSAFFPEVFFHLAYINLSENKFCQTDFSRRICLYPLLGGDSLIQCGFLKKKKKDSHPCFRHF